jgi:hypothetical protein
VEIPTRLHARTSVMPKVTEHTFRDGYGRERNARPGCLASDRVSGGVDYDVPLVVHFRKQCPIQPALRASEPFHLDVDGPPFGLNGLSLEVLDGLQVERTTVTEAQSGIDQRHGGTLA